MVTRRKDKITTDLTRVQNQFKEWRKARKRRTRIPPALWSAAVQVAQRYGVGRVSSLLRVQPQGLSRRLAAGSAAIETPHQPCGTLPVRSGFVELPASISSEPIQPGWMVELQRVDGARLTLRGAGRSGVEVTTLVTAFLRGG